MKEEKKNQTLETVCTSLEMSKKLDEAGVGIETPFWWVDEEQIKGCPFIHYSGDPDLDEKVDHIYRAYCFSQLWNVLPTSIDKLYGGNNAKTLYCDDAIGYERFRGNDLSSVEIKTFGEIDVERQRVRSLTDRAGGCLLWCLKEGYLKSEDINY